MKITIPQPCHENWDAMTPAEKGRFCSVCSKTVRDFTRSLDDEIRDVFSNSTVEICGNFYESQLNRDLQYSYINSIFMKFALGVILTTGGLVSVNAQQNVTNDTLQTAKIEEIVPNVLLGKPHSKMMAIGATTVVSEREIIKAPENKLPEISGKLPGLNMNQVPNDSSGRAQITIGKGNSSLSGNNQEALVVLNKKIVSLKELQELDPNSIKTMNVLKGESATALYGSKARNGVIVVTTKRKKKL